MDGWDEEQNGDDREEREHEMNVGHFSTLDLVFFTVGVALVVRGERGVDQTFFI